MCLSSQHSLYILVLSSVGPPLSGLSTFISVFPMVTLYIFILICNALLGNLHGKLARWRKWRACDVGEAKEGLERLIFQPFCHFTYVTAHSPSLPSLYLHHSSFSNTSVFSSTSQLILQPFCCFTYITAHSPTLLLFHLRHSSFSNPSVASSTSQLILQPFLRFSYITGSSLMSPGEPPMVISLIPFA